MQILIPMVGAGQRFRDAGYATPKPLIPVDGVPMVVRVVEELPKAERVVFVVNKEHVQEHDIDEILTEHFPGARIVVAPGLTQGQACSVQLGIAELDPEQDVLVAACDNTHIVDAAALRQRILQPDTDCLIWTYRNEPRVLVNPNWYGWVATDAKNKVVGVSVKKPLSDNPLLDHVISGTFWFRSTRLLNDGIAKLTQGDHRVNGEFYLDSVPELLLKDGFQVEAFEVEKYIGWGTPADYEDYRKWSAYVRRQIDRVAA